MAIVEERTTGRRAEVPGSAGPSVNVPVGGRPGGPAREVLIVDGISVSVNISDDDGGAAAFLRIPGNEVCIDCNAPRPTWASLSLGCALCISCAGLHRGLGVQTSYVRSLALDDLSREEAATLRRSGGNASLIAFARDLDAVTTWEAISPADRRFWYTTSAADVYRRRLATLRAEVRADLAAEANAVMAARVEPPDTAEGRCIDETENEAVQRLVAMGFYDLNVVREALLQNRGDIGATALALAAPRRRR